MSIAANREQAIRLTDIPIATIDAFIASRTDLEELSTEQFLDELNLYIAQGH